MASHELPTGITLDPNEYELDDKRLGTVLSDLETANGIRIHIADARPESTELDENGKYYKREGKTFIVPREFLAYTDDSINQLRDGMLADALGARIIAVDTPGAGFHETSGKTTLRQKWNALRGNFTDQADLQLKAVKELFPDLDKAGLIGYSLGAKAVATMLEGSTLEDNGIEVESVDLIEAVNDRNWLLPKLMINMMREDKQVDRYLLETKEIGLGTTAYDREEEDPTKKIKGRGLPVSIDSKLLALGMSTAGFAKKLAKSREANPEKFEGVPVNIYRADGSSMARQETNIKTAEAIGADYHEVGASTGEKPLGHRFWISLGRVAVLGKEMAKRHKTKSSR